MTDVAVLDANVLAPVVRRAVWSVLSAAELFTPVVSPKLLCEAEHAMRRIGAEGGDLPLQFDRLQIIEPSDRADIILPDPDDLHVVEAALSAKSKLIVTENIRDFPRKILAPLGIVTRTSDQFVCDLAERDAPRVHSALKRLPAVLPRIVTVDTLPAVLRRAGFRRTLKTLEPAL